MKKEKRSQKEVIKALLLSGREITPLDAMRELGCYRLQARISELKAEGMKIITESQASVSRITGRPIRYAKYKLAKIKQ